ncbi:cell division protein FtsL [Anaerobacillus sp. MEB173]|uniref:cell division protein FtsL n=1 Tax=Anaerobacillus sp. MEB173 TaxID=3383345 RepID=UPI003F91133D
MNNLAHKIQRQQKQKEQPVVQPQQNEQKKSPITKGEKALYLLTILGIVFASYIILTNYASIYMANKDIQVLEATIAQQTSLNEGLQLQVVELAAPERILTIAKEQLGMNLDEKQVKVVN